MVSNLLTLLLWRCDITLFDGFFNPLPAVEYKSLTLDALVALVAGGVAVGEDKARMPYFVPCLLQVAPLTPRMQAKTGQTEGKQRSAAHVVLAMALVFDLDGLTQEQFDELLDRLRADGISFLCYTTHSHGRADKPGIRARVVVPVDRPLNATEYAQAWLGFDQHYCGGAIAAADASGRNLWQQQGVWSCHPDREALAFRIIHKAGVASADTLIACAPKLKTRERREYSAVPLPPTATVKRLEAALPWSDADTTPTWIVGMTAFKALALAIGEDVARTLAVRYSELASDGAKAQNDDRRYDPATFFDNVRPTMPPEAAFGTLLAMARDGAVAAMNADRGKAEFSAKGREAALYLATYHRRLFDELTKEATA